MDMLDVQCLMVVFSCFSHELWSLYSVFGWLVDERSLNKCWTLNSAFLVCFSSYLDLFFSVNILKAFPSVSTFSLWNCVLLKIVHFSSLFFTFETKLYVEKRNNSLLN